LSIDPGAVKARFGYAATLIRLHQYREARNRLVEATELYPNELSFARARRRLFAAAPDDRVRDGHRAQRSVQALVARHPRTIELAETMAMALAEVGNTAPRCSLSVKRSRRRSGRPAATWWRLADNLTRYQAGGPAACRGEMTSPSNFEVGRRQ
jgi:predicted Zn-dependent protease